MMELFSNNKISVKNQNLISFNKNIYYLKSCLYTKQTVVGVVIILETLQLFEQSKEGDNQIIVSSRPKPAKEHNMYAIFSTTDELLRK